jgi:hypothetical protein
MVDSVESTPTQWHLPRQVDLASLQLQFGFSVFAETEVWSNQKWLWKVATASKVKYAAMYEVKLCSYMHMLDLNPSPFRIRHGYTALVIQRDNKNSKRTRRQVQFRVVCYHDD